MSKESPHKHSIQMEIQQTAPPAVIVLPEYQSISSSRPEYIHRFQEILVSLKKYSQKHGQIYDDDDDFRWFTSGEANVKRFRGKYIAIWMNLKT